MLSLRVFVLKRNPGSKLYFLCNQLRMCLVSQDIKKNKGDGARGYRAFILVKLKKESVLSQAFQNTFHGKSVVEHYNYITPRGLNRCLTQRAFASGVKYILMWAYAQHKC